MNQQRHPRANWGRLLAGLLLIGVCLGLTGTPPVVAAALAAAGPFTPQDLQAFFDATLAEQMAEEHLVGATVAVVQNGDLAFAKGYGYADLDGSVPVQADRTLFYIGSDGKLFTWTAVMQLVEQGKLDLHADVNTYLDFEIPATFAEPITMHHLMTHTAGFEEEMSALLQDDPARVLPLREFLVRHLPERVYVPGTVFAYSNYGTALAGYVVERVSGQPYEQYITEHLLIPLGMNHSAAVQPLPSELAGDMSKGYKYRNGSYDAVDFEWAAAAPCAAVRGTATDVSRFMIAHLDGGCADGTCILQADTLAEMHHQQFTHHPQLTGMAYGFVESVMNGQRILWHMGESARFVTVLALIPEQNVGLLVSYNTPPVDGQAILHRFLDHFYPISRAPLAVQQPLPGWTERADTLNGTYVPARSAHTSPQKIIGGLQALPVRADDDTLAMGDQRYVETEPWLFRQVEGDRVLVFRQDAQSGQVWLFWGPFAYFKVPWHQTLAFQLPMVAACALILSSAWIAWPVATWVNRRRGNRPSTGTQAARWLAGGLGLLDLGLLAWFVALMLSYGETFVYPAETVGVIVWVYWLAVPLTLAVLTAAVLAWVRRSWHWAWRAHYTLVAVAAVVFLWFLSVWNLLGG